MSQPVDRLMRRPEVENLIGLKRAQIYRMIDAGEFPRPVRLSTRVVGWRSSDVAEWVASRPAA